MPFDFIVYAEAVRDYVRDLETYAKAKGPGEGFNLTSLHQAADDFTRNAAEFHAWNKAWEDAFEQGYETSTLFQRPDAPLQTKCCILLLLEQSLIRKL